MSVDKNCMKTAADEAHQQGDVSRRSLLRGATITAGGAVLLAAAMTTQPAEAKMAQTAAAYVPTAKGGQHCSECALFIAPSSCRLVDGVISPTGYCRFFVKKG
jgi:hypothetical protein